MDWRITKPPKVILAGDHAAQPNCSCEECTDIDFDADCFNCGEISANSLWFCCGCHSEDCVCEIFQIKGMDFILPNSTNNKKMEDYIGLTIEEETEQVIATFGFPT